MTDERSPWATPETEIVVAGVTTATRPPVSPPVSPPVARTQPAYRTGTVTNLGTVASLGTASTRGTASGRGMASGLGTASTRGTAGGLDTGGPGLPPPDVISNGGDDDEDPLRRNKRILRIFAAGAAGILAIGLVVVLGMVLTGRTGAPGLLDRAKGPSDVAPPLAKRCPPPSEPADGAQNEVPPTPPGPRTVDSDAGISYKAYGAPWEPWDQIWTAGDLHVSYKVGQHFVTEHFGLDDYHASILSASVPATVNDALVLDLKCTGRQVAADVRGKYYPQPNTIEMIRDEQVELGGRQAWVTKFRLHFNEPGLQAKDELVGIALIDVGRPEAAILYVSIPGTHRQYDSVVDEVLDSVRPV